MASERWGERPLLVIVPQAGAGASKEGVALSGRLQTSNDRQLCVYSRG